MIPLILAAVFTVTDSIMAAHVMVSVLAALGIPLVYLLGRDLYDWRPGLIAAVVYAASPEHLMESHKLHIDPILPTVWLLVAVLGYRMLDGRSSWYAVLTGAFTGIAVLSKFTSLVLLPLLILLLFLDHAERQDWDLSLNGFITTALSLVYDRRLWQYTTGFITVLAPYLLWSYTTYGHPLYPFIQGAELSGAAQPFLTYINGYSAFIALPFYLGLLLFLPQLRRIADRDIYYPLLFVIVLYVPLQFMIANKELRYLLPVVPFLALMIGRGLNQVRRWDQRVLAPLVLVLLLASTMYLPHMAGLYVEMAATGQTTIKEPTTPTYDAAMWMKRNTPEDALLYTNYEWPVLAYYSERPIHLMPMTQPFQNEISTYMTHPGYVFLTERAPDSYDPSIAFAKDDPRFEQVAVFADGDTYLFQYTPNSTA